MKESKRGAGLESAGRMDEDGKMRKIYGKKRCNMFSSLPQK